MSDYLNSFGNEQSLLSELKNNNFNIYSLVWLDNTIDTNEYIRVQENLGFFIDHFEKFNESNSCEKYIQSTSIKTRIILIIEEHFGIQLIPRIHQLQQISDIHISSLTNQFQGDWFKQYKKIRDIHNKFNDIINNIKNIRRQRRQYEIDEYLSINFSHSNKEKSAMEINGEFIQTQLLIDCLNRMNTVDTDKDKLALVCNEIYKGNQSQQKLIKEFQQTYSSDKAVEWYTKDSFLYRLLNKALRIQNTDLLLLFHFFIRDIGKQLKSHQSSSTMTLYRGQMISDDELNLFENSVNKFISIHSFFSTSLDRNVALIYIDSNLVDENIQKVLFEIHADPSKNSSKPFAQISSISYFPVEQEVLMMLGSVFQINSVDNFKDNEKMKLIRMTLCDHNDDNINLVYDYMRKNRGTGIAQPTAFGRALIGMAKYDAAERLFKYLMKTFSFDHPGTVNCYQGLAKIYCEKCDFDQSLVYFNRALKFLDRQSNFNQLHIAYIFNNMGEVYQKKKDADQALESFQRALTIFSKELGDRSENVAWCFNNIGIVYLIKKDYKQALEYLKKACNIKEELLPDKHPCLGNIFINIGNVYYYLGEYDEALNNYYKTYDIFQNSLTQKHPSIARVMRNIGLIHELKGDFSEALSYYNKVLDLRQQLLHIAHPDLIESERDLKRISLKNKYSHRQKNLIRTF